MSQAIIQPHCMHCRTYWHFQFTLKLKHQHCEYSLHFYYYDKISWPKSFVEGRVYLASGSRRICKNLSWKENMVARARSQEYRSWTANRNQRGRIGNAFGFESSKPAPTDMLPPARSQLLKFVNATKCGPSIRTSASVKNIHMQTITSW